MSGHSKWAQIKRQKGVNDARRGQLFTKVGREITVAAREGGGDPDANFRLRLAVQKAREVNMPQENIQRAINRGTGADKEGGQLEELFYEGYGPGGVAMMVQVLTDNRNRAAADVRNVFTRGGGNMGESGSVAWMFEQKGLITVELDGVGAEDAEMAAIDAGADDIKESDGVLEVYTDKSDLDAVRKALDGQQLKISSAELVMVPKASMELDEKSATSVARLIDRLEELDDVQRVFINAEISDEIMASVSSYAATAQQAFARARKSRCPNPNQTRPPPEPRKRRRRSGGPPAGCRSSIAGRGGWAPAAAEQAGTWPSAHSPAGRPGNTRPRR
jgi:YebC/PmpR family DNA-binding regulatory protein